MSNETGYYKSNSVTVTFSIISTNGNTFIEVRRRTDDNGWVGGESLVHSLNNNKGVVTLLRY